MFGQKISQDEGNSLKARFQKNNPEKTKAVIFDRAAVESVLGHRDTHYIVISFGETDDGINTVVISGYDKNNKEIGATLTDRGGPCPPYC